MHDYDRQSGRPKTAGVSFKKHLDGMLDALQKAHFQTRGAEGLIHYRLYDRDGQMKDRFTSEPVLDPQQRRQAENARKAVLKVQKDIEGALSSVRDLEGMARWLDENLDYQ